MNEKPKEVEAIRTLALEVEAATEPPIGILIRFLCRSASRGDEGTRWYWIPRDAATTLSEAIVHKLSGIPCGLESPKRDS